MKHHAPSLSFSSVWLGPVALIDHRRVEERAAVDGRTVLALALRYVDRDGAGACPSGEVGGSEAHVVEACDLESLEPFCRVFGAFGYLRCTGFGFYGRLNLRRGTMGSRVGLQQGIALLIMFSLLCCPAVTWQASASQLTDASQDGEIVIADVATSPALPNLIFLTKKRTFMSTHPEWLPPLYSVDGGVTWEEVAATPWVTTTLRSMVPAVVPREDGSPRLIIGTTHISTDHESKGTLYRSGDWGLVWAEDVIVPEDRLLSIGASAADPRRLYLTWLHLVHDGLSYITYSMTSGDAGISWKRACGLITDQNWLGISPSPVLPERVCFEAAPGSAGWQCSDDAGDTCSDLGEVYPNIVAWDAVDALRLYSLDPAGTSDDGGVTWSDWTEHPSEYGQLFAHPTKTQTVFILDNGLYRSDNAGVDWQLASTFEGGYLTPDYSTAGRILWVKGACLWASADDGVSWKSLLPGCERFHVFVPHLSYADAGPVPTSFRPQENQQ